MDPGTARYFKRQFALMDLEWSGGKQESAPNSPLIRSMEPGQELSFSKSLYTDFEELKDKDFKLGIRRSAPNSPLIRSLETGKELKSLGLLHEEFAKSGDAILEQSSTADASKPLESSTAMQLLHDEIKELEDAELQLIIKAGGGAHDLVKMAACDEAKARISKRARDVAAFKEDQNLQTPHSRSSRLKRGRRSVWTMGHARYQTAIWRRDRG